MLLVPEAVGTEDMGQSSDMQQAVAAHREENDSLVLMEAIAALCVTVEVGEPDGPFQVHA